MCDRFSFSLPKEKIIRRFRVRVAEAPQAHYNLTLGDSVSIIIDGQPDQLAQAAWGIPGRHNRPLHHLFIRSAASQPMPATRLLLQQRCMILADGFYVWKKVTRRGRIPYRVVLKWNMPFAFAGVWQANPAGGHTCAMLTTEANTLLSSITARMPVLLALEQEKAWLKADTALPEAMRLIGAYPVGQMRMYPVSAQISQPGMNSPELVQPVHPADQFGNYMLFD